MYQFLHGKVATSASVLLELRLSDSGYTLCKECALHVRNRAIPGWDGCNRIGRRFVSSHIEVRFSFIDLLFIYCLSGGFACKPCSRLPRLSRLLGSTAQQVTPFDSFLRRRHYIHTDESAFADR
jgi:hypothetical protein